MDLLLLGITVVSLLLALFLGAAAWGMWREERARSEARVAALATAASVEEQPAAQTTIQPVAATVAASKAAPWSAPTSPRRLPIPVARDEQPSHELGEGFLGSAVAAPPSGSRQRGLAIAASVLFIAALTGAYFTIYDDATHADAAAAGTVAGASPLELISLRHERQNGGLSITGLVRNPSGGQSVEQLAAVVFLFDQQGEFVASSRAGVDFTRLVPGDESPFVVRVEAPANVARYRVSFRTDAGVVPHIDRRGQEPISEGRGDGSTGDQP
jgi:hypothetical protein